MIHTIGTYYSANLVRNATCIMDSLFLHLHDLTLHHYRFLNDINALLKITKNEYGNFLNKRKHSVREHRR